MAVEDCIREYYAALRDGGDLTAFFRDDPALVKFGISDRLWGYDAVAEALRDQTQTTTEWTVESRRLRIGQRGSTAWFSDEVRMEWTNIDSEARHGFDSRWSGTLTREDGEWAFVGMHVSAPHALDAHD